MQSAYIRGFQLTMCTFFDGWFGSQLAEQYGSDVASDVLAKSRSNLSLSQSSELAAPRTLRC